MRLQRGDEALRFGEADVEGADGPAPAPDTAAQQQAWATIPAAARQRQQRSTCDHWVMSYAPGFSDVRLVSKAQVNDLMVSGPLRPIAPVLGGFTLFCSQIGSWKPWRGALAPAAAEPAADDLVRSGRSQSVRGVLRQRKCMAPECETTEPESA